MVDARGRPRGEIPDDFAGRIATNVIRLRKKHGLTVAECVEQSGIPRVQWYRLEAGTRPRITGALADRVAEFFEVDPSELTRRPKKR